MIDPVKDHLTFFGGTEKIRFLKTILQPVIIFTPKEIPRWDVTKEDQC